MKEEKAEIKIAGHRAVLLPQKALWLPEEKTLVVADVHWGKAGHFRKHGLAIPSKTNNDNAQRLSELIHETGVEKVIFAGDLFHSRHNNEVEAFRDWRAGFPGVDFSLVIGNHDILSTGFYEQCGMEIFPEKQCLGNLCMMHDAPEKGSDLFVVHGHIHPGIRLFGKGRQQVSVPCFAVDVRRMILPAFGDFTGCFYLQASDFQQVFAVTERAVLRVK